MKSYGKIVLKLCMLALFLYFTPFFEGFTSMLGKTNTLSNFVYHQQPLSNDVSLKKQLNVLSYNTETEDKNVKTTSNELMIVPYTNQEVKVEEVVENKSEEKTNTTKKNGKKIYIYNTHQSEEYQGDKTVMDAAAVLAEQLISYGYEVIVETNDFTKYCNEQGLTYNDLYMVSNKFLNDALVKYGGFDLIIDLHRDSVPREYTYVTIDGVSYAKTMMVIGGAAKYAQSSTQISKTITDNVNQIKNGIMKSVFTREGAYYNQYVCEGIVLMECGSENNTFEEVTNSIQVVAKGIHKMMEG